MYIVRIRYAELGFLEWWNDVKAARDDFEMKLKNGEINSDNNTFYQRQNTDYTRLEKLALSGDEASLLTGLLDRQKQAK